MPKRPRVDIRSKYDISSTTWSDIIALALAKMSMATRSAFQNAVLIFLVVLMVSYFSFTFYFHLHPRTVLIPGKYTEASVFSKEEIADDPINLLSVKQFEVNSLPAFLAIKALNWGYNDYVDTLIPEERNQQKELSIGSDLYDMQLSAFLALNDYLGTPRKSTKKLVVNAITVGGGVPPSVLPADEILSIDGVDIKDTIDVEVAKLKYQQREVKVLRDGQELDLITSFYGVDVRKLLTLTNEQDYQDFYAFADLQLEGFEGRSAGAALTLSYYNAEVEDVAQGRNIALTGTIDEYGNIGFITGIRQKTVLAIKNKADIMFVPSDNHITQNFTLAKQVLEEKDSSIELVAVDNFSDIIDYLKR